MLRLFLNGYHTFPPPFCTRAIVLFCLFVGGDGWCPWSTDLMMRSSSMCFVSARACSIILAARLSVCPSVCLPSPPALSCQ
ncbi:MAG: hypothetical protein J3R72DRAFT_440674 [Linnemannia gamsii]|nr:MAG: hypothetical protein J3R72DRAFT_440674 [Linnemannia gamsii]